MSTITANKAEKKRLPRTRAGYMIGNTARVTDYWIEHLQTPNANRYEEQSRNSMSFRGDDLKHYGWWTLAHGIRVNGITQLVVVNGDVYGGGSGFGPSTQSRRLDAERALSRAGIPFVIVPFSALQTARLDIDSIRIVESLDAREMLRFTEPQSLSEYRERHSWRLDDDGLVNLYGPLGKVRPIHVEGDLYRFPFSEHRLGESVFTAVSEEWRKGRPITRRARYLSGFDAQDGNLYFLCELPRGCKAASVAEAYEALKPEPVKAAMESGLNVLRQGDIFAIPTSLRTRDLNRRTPNPGRSVADRVLLGSTHTATEVRELNGDTYARGIMRHEPIHRPRDHRNVKLGDGRTWYRIVKNTVPASFDRTTPRAWTMNGKVD